MKKKRCKFEHVFLLKKLNLYSLNSSHTVCYNLTGLGEPDEEYAVGSDDEDEKILANLIQEEMG